VETVSPIARERNAECIVPTGGLKCVKQIYARDIAGIVGRWMQGYCKTGKRNSRIWRNASQRPFSSSSPPRPPKGFLHYDGMHNAGWVRRRAVRASYIAMADGRDSEKDFPNRISSPRTAYIFHDRGRANRLPLLSSIFRAPRGITAGYGGSMRTNGNVSRGLSHGSRKLAGKSERKTYSKAGDI